MIWDAREWRIPGTRMKSGVEHRVPLSNAALAVLEQARTLKGGSDLLFPSPLKKGRPLSNMTMTKLLRDVKLADRTTVHASARRSGIGAQRQTNHVNSLRQL